MTGITAAHSDGESNASLGDGFSYSCSAVTSKAYSSDDVWFWKCLDHPTCAKWSSGSHRDFCVITEPQEGSAVQAISKQCKPVVSFCCGIRVTRETSRARNVIGASGKVTSQVSNEGASIEKKNIVAHLPQNSGTKKNTSAFMQITFNIYLNRNIIHSGYSNPQAAIRDRSNQTSALLIV